MTAPAFTQVSDYLPDDALVAPTLLDAIGECITTWSARWFGDRTVRRDESSGCSPRVVDRPAPRHGWRNFGDGIWIDWSEQTPRGLALHALGRADHRSKSSAGDDTLLQLLGERIARDLGATLGSAAAAVSSTPDGAPGRAVTLKLRSTAQALGLTVAIDCAMLAALRKQQCPPWLPIPAKVQRLAVTLADVPVAIETTLGTARLGLSDLEGIEPGDTIVFEQRIDAPVAVRATATGTMIAHAKLVREDGQLTLIAN